MNKLKNNKNKHNQNKLILHSQIKSAIDELLMLPGISRLKKIAVFDMDNTLLVGDIGDAALAYLLENEITVGFKWSEYLNLINNGELKTAFTKASSAFAGMEVGCVRRLAKEILDYQNEYISFFEENTVFKVLVPGINPQMQNLINYLKNLEFDIYIISASNQYLVEEVATLMGIPAVNCFGMKNRIKDIDGVQILEEEINEPVPVGNGKTTILNDIFGNDKPIIGGGDSIQSDIPFLNLVNSPGLIFWLGSEDLNNPGLQQLSQGRTFIFPKNL